MVICLEQGADDLHTVQLLAYPGYPGKEAVKWVYAWNEPYQPLCHSHRALLQFDGHLFPFPLR